MCFLALAWCYRGARGGGTSRIPAHSLSPKSGLASHSAITFPSSEKAAAVELSQDDSPGSPSKARQVLRDCESPIRPYNPGTQEDDVTHTRGERLMALAKALVHD